MFAIELTVISIQGLSLMAPQHPMNPVKKTMAPTTTKVMAAACTRESDVSTLATCNSWNTSSSAKAHIPTPNTTAPTTY